VGGPIVRAKFFLPKIKQNLSLTKENAGIALFMILSGLIKKAVISDYISLNFVDRVFDSPLSYTSIENLLAVYGYSLQIYCDFSGYSDMAIGLALLMGFTLPQNFNNPYRSASFGEFWQRWHISLSAWLRDYLYISMGGNRKGKIRTYINLFLTMLIGGLWHGAAWKFVVWGGFHGLALAVERYLKSLVKLPAGRWITFVRIVIVFHFVAFCWIFFRAGNFGDAYKVISQITNLSFNLSDWWTVIAGYKNVLLLIVIGYILHFFPLQQADKIKQLFYKTPAAWKAVYAGFVFWVVYATASSGAQPFIYFQF
jgi:D-alanyl-lipoteichoic acid acyltransferase DltB (MBOAT superfamily)